MPWQTAVALLEASKTTDARTLALCTFRLLYGTEWGCGHRAQVSIAAMVVWSCYALPHRLDRTDAGLVLASLDLEPGTGWGKLK